MRLKDGNYILMKSTPLATVPSVAEVPDEGIERGFWQYPLVFCFAVPLRSVDLSHGYIEWYFE